MKFGYNIFTFVILLLIFLGCVFLFVWQKEKRNKELSLWPNYKTEEIEIENKKYIVVVAETSSQWQKGLMYVRKPVDFDGMMFKSNIPSPQVFWNQNTFENLDIYWIRKGEVIGKSFLPSIEAEGLRTVSSSGMVDTVIEIIR